MTAPAPNPAPVPSPSEAYLHQRLVGAGDTVEVQSGAVEAVLAELERLRAAPGPAHERAAAELVPSLDEYRAAVRFWRGYCMEVRAELDRLRALIAAVLAECDEMEKAPDVSTVRITAVVETFRDLLGGEGRP